MEKTYRDGTCLNKKGKPSIIRWRGLLCGTSRRGRILTFLTIVVFAASLTFTQLGLVGIGVQGNYVGYCIVLLAPIALGALLLGVLFGMLVGFSAGLVLFVHSQVQPLDYYEMSFVTPMSSIVLFTVAAFFFGLFVAIALRKEPPLGRRVIYFAIVGVFSSFCFTMTFVFNVIMELSIQIYDTAVQTGAELTPDTIRAYSISAVSLLGNPYLQILGDAALMFVSCLAGELAVRKLESLKGGFRLASRFRVWLLLVVSLAFVVTAAFGFSVITEQAKDSAQKNMESEISYLKNQLKAHESRGDSLSAFLESDSRSNQALSEDEVKVLKSVFSLDSLLEGYSKQVDGAVVVFYDGLVVASDDSEYAVGSNVNDYTGFAELQWVVSEEVPVEGMMAQLVYDETMLTKDDVETAEERVAQSETSSAQMVFACFGRYEGYTIMVITPATEVFSGRNATMAWISLSVLVLLVAVFLSVSRLLNIVVVRRIDEANGVLDEITNGNLDARVDIRDSVEFASLSGGINTTVDALKGWIAEAEQRMDAELATAKAIQESALPRTFPPFPDILKFDVYAVMGAARKVGGDFYDFFLVGDDAGPDHGKLGFVIADVSGKGVPAALFMMKAKTQLRDYLASGMEPGEAVENANRQLCDGNDEDMFVTAWVGVLDYATGHVEYVNAGHNPPLLWSFAEAEGDASDERLKSGSWRWLTEKSGMPLGVFDGLPYESYSLDCRIGDQFLLYTDGVTEAMSVEGELYGEDRLLATVDRGFSSHPRELVGTVWRDVAAHADGAEQSDDITVLALEVGVPPETTATISVPADDAMLPVVNEFIHTELDRRLCPLRAQKQLDIAVEELFVNVCHYAYGGEWNKSGGMVRVGYTYSAEPPSVVVTIIDEGVPYDPLAKPDAVTPDDIMDVPIGGLGILMAKKNVDEMTYERVDGSNVVTIVKKW